MKKNHAFLVKLKYKEERYEISNILFLNIIFHVFYFLRIIIATFPIKLIEHLR